MELSPKPSSSTHPDDSPSAQKTPARCRHVSRGGKRCRYAAVSPMNPFCKTHIRIPNPTEPILCAQIGDLFQDEADGFHSPSGLRDALYHLFFAVTEGVVTERRATVLCYIIQTVLNVQRAVIEEEKRDQAMEAQRRWDSIGSLVPQAKRGDDDNVPAPNPATCSDKYPAPAHTENTATSTATSLDPVVNNTTTPASETKVTPGTQKTAPSSSFPSAFSPHAPSPPSKPATNYAAYAPPPIPAFPPPRISPQDQAELDRCDRILQERRWRTSRPSWRGPG